MLLKSMDVINFNKKDNRILWVTINATIYGTTFKKNAIRATPTSKKPQQTQLKQYHKIKQEYFYCSLPKNKKDKQQFNS